LDGFLVRKLRYKVKHIKTSVKKGLKVMFGQIFFAVVITKIVPLSLAEKFKSNAQSAE